MRTAASAIREYAPAFTEGTQRACTPEIVPFVPRRGMTNGHVQTILANFLPRTAPLPASESLLIEVAPARGKQIASQVLCECNWQPAERRMKALTVILVHGLEGSSRSQYMVGNASKLFAAGCNVVRMNMRNCGGRGDEMLRRTTSLYHSGLSGDLGAVMRRVAEMHGLERFALIGYSLGGNVALKLVGELGSTEPRLKAVVGVSPVVDLAVSADELHVGMNRIYERRFLGNLLKRFRRKAFLFPRAFDVRLGADIASIRDFDQKITALYSGFLSADDYYERASSARVVDKIAVPTLVLHAADDPFIRYTEETLRKLHANPMVRYVETEHGGHCAFLGRRQGGDDGYWAESTARAFLMACVR